METDAEIFDRTFDKQPLDKICFVKRNYRQRADSNQRTEIVLDNQSNSLTTCPPCLYNRRNTNYHSLSFLVSIDSNSNRPVDALFWSEIDCCWFFSYLDCLYGNLWFSTENLISRLRTIFSVKWKKIDRWYSNSRTESLLYQQSNSLTTRPPCLYNRRNTNCHAFLASDFNQFWFRSILRCTFLVEIDYCLFFSFLFLSCNPFYFQSTRRWTLLIRYWLLLFFSYLDCLFGNGWRSLWQKTS